MAFWAVLTARPAFHLDFVCLQAVPDQARTREPCPGVPEGLFGALYVDTQSARPGDGRLGQGQGVPKAGKSGLDLLAHPKGSGVPGMALKAGRFDQGDGGALHPVVAVAGGAGRGTRLFHSRTMGAAVEVRFGARVTGPTDEGAVGRLSGRLTGVMPCTP